MVSPPTLFVDDRGAQPVSRSWEPIDRAREVLGFVFGHLSPKSALTISRLRRVGRGLSRTVIRGRVELRPDPAGWSGEHAVRLPHPDSDDATARACVREARVLMRLRGGLSGALRVPEVIALVPDRFGPAIVHRFIAGPTLFTAARGPATKRAMIRLGALAAAVHAIPIDAALRRLVPGPRTARAYAEAALAPLEEARDPVLRDALSWARAHLPPASPSALLHGDLLAQNVVLPTGGGPPVLLDWERSERGDPAYDLFVCLRATRRAHEPSRGHATLFEAYRAAAGAALDEPATRIYELAMHATHHAEARRGETAYGTRAQILARVRALLD